VAIAAVARRHARALRRARHRPRLQRQLGGGEVIGPLVTALTHVHDLAYLPDGRLLLGGDIDGSYAAFELRDAADPTVVVGSYLVEGGAPIEEVSVSADGALIAGVASEFLALFDGALEVRVMDLPAGHLGVSAAITPTHGVVLTAGSEGSVRAWLTDGHGIREGARLDLVDPVSIRTDASGTLAFAGTRDGMIYVLGCEE
jgi:hypothetical protein